MKLRIDFAGLLLFVVRGSGRGAWVPHILAVDSKGNGGHVTHLLVDAQETTAVFKRANGAVEPCPTELSGVELDLAALGGSAGMPTTPRGLLDFATFVQSGHKKLPPGLLNPVVNSVRIGTRFKVAGGAFSSSNPQCVKWNHGTETNAAAAMVVTWEIDLGNALEAELPVISLRPQSIREGVLRLTPTRAEGDVAISLCHTIERPNSIDEIHDDPTESFDPHHLHHYDDLWPHGMAKCDVVPCDDGGPHEHVLRSEARNTYPRICPMMMIEE